LSAGLPSGEIPPISTTTFYQSNPLVNNDELIVLVKQKDADLLEKQEELDSQRGMLSAAIEELAKYNRSLEAALVALKERNSDLEKLLYQSSHGLRSPLSSIQGILNLMKAESMSDVAQEYRGYIELKSGHMLEILNSLTTLAELITKNVKKEVVDVDRIVGGLIDYFSALSETNGVRFDFRSDGKSENIETDAFLIHAFLKQVMMNAVIFREPQKGGFVSIETSVQNDTIKFCVEDDGDGIDPVLENRIFEMFFRGSGKSAGSGLGLFISRLAVDLLHGSIRFWKGERGTVFEIVIPIESKNQDSLQPSGPIDFLAKP
jgi:signal transduction histidine kinase